MGQNALPGSLDAEIDRDLAGRGHHQIQRRLGLGLLGLLVVAALFNFFGQRPTTTTAAGASGAIEVRAPNDLRGGVIFEGRFVISAQAAIAHPTLVLEPGWVEGITLNSLEPTPTNERSLPDGSLSLEFPSIPAGRSTTVYTQWAVNPTNVGRRSAGVELLDGEMPLAHVDRTVTVYP